MNNATLSQGKYLFEMFETLESGKLQALIVSGLLIDLRRCAAELDPTKVDRDKFQRILGINPSVFMVKMDGPETTDGIVRYLLENGFTFVNNLITQANFPLAARETPEEDEIVIHDPGCSFSEGKGLAILKQEGLLRPTYEHALRFARQHGTATTFTKKPFIIFLHEPWLDPNRDRRVLCVDRDPGGRLLLLGGPEGRFRDHCVVAGVRSRKQPSAA